MSSVLLEVAIQLKGTLSFALGLGAMFSVAKSFLTNLFILPGVGDADTAVGLEITRLKRRLIGLTVTSVLLFLAAVALYFFGALADLSADALQQPGAMLTPAQDWDIGLLILVAVAMVVAEALGSVWKYRLTLVAAQA